MEGLFGDNKRPLPARCSSFAMQNTISAKCEQYVGYANHCLILASTTNDDESRVLLRQMAAEWLELAEGALNKQAARG